MSSEADDPPQADEEEEAKRRDGPPARPSPSNAEEKSEDDRTYSTALETLRQAADIIADANSWCTEQNPGGYEPKVYVGAGLLSIVTPQELYRLPYVGYWASFSRVPEVSTRGYQMRQLFHYPQGECRVREVFPHAPPEVADMFLDVDVAMFDYKGGRVTAVAS